MRVVCCSWICPIIDHCLRYAECYPGLAEMDDAVIDSDDEADFSKMDMGNKKGPVGRWVVCFLFSQQL